MQRALPDGWNRHLTNATRLFLALVALLCSTASLGHRTTNDLIFGLYLELPQNFERVATQDVTFLDTSSFCSLSVSEQLWPSGTEIKKSSTNTETQVPADTGKGPSQTRASGQPMTPPLLENAGVKKAAFVKDEAEFVTWSRQLITSLGAVTLTARCPAWSALSVEARIMAALTTAELDRSSIDDVFSSLPFIANLPDGWGLAARFANSIVVQQAGIGGTRTMTVSSLKMSQPNVSISELSRTLLTGQSSLSGITIEGEKMLSISSYIAYGIRAKVISKGQTLQFRQIVMDLDDYFAVATVSAPAGDADAMLAEDLRLLVTSLRSRL
jgi:hypothetical protein